jgi:hypothetical protein
LVKIAVPNQISGPPRADATLGDSKPATATAGNARTVFRNMTVLRRNDRAEKLPQI